MEKNKRVMGRKSIILLSTILAIFLLIPMASADWFDNDWTERKELILIDPLGGTYDRNEGYSTTVTGLTLATGNCTQEIRLTLGENISVPVYAEDSGVNECTLYFTYRKNAPNINVSYYVYYNNPTAPSPSYSTNLSWDGLAGSTLFNNNINLTVINDTLSGVFNDFAADELNGNIPIPFGPMLKDDSFIASSKYLIEEVINTDSYIRIRYGVNGEPNKFNMSFYEGTDYLLIDDMSGFNPTDGGFFTFMALTSPVTKCLHIRNGTDEYFQSCGDLSNFLLTGTQGGYVDYYRQGDNKTLFQLWKEGSDPELQIVNTHMYLRTGDTNDPQVTTPAVGYQNLVGDVNLWSRVWIGLNDETETSRNNTFYTFHNAPNDTLGAAESVFGNATAPEFTVIPANATITDSETLDVTFVAVNTSLGSQIDSYTVDNGNFTMNPTTGQLTSGLLSIGTYEMVVTVNETLDGLNTSVAYSMEVIVTPPVPSPIELICSDSDAAWVDAAQLTGLLFTIGLVGLILSILVLSFTGIIDVGRLQNSMTLEDAPAMITIIGLTFLVIATMSYLIADNICIAYGG